MCAGAVQVSGVGCGARGACGSCQLLAQLRPPVPWRWLYLCRCVCCGGSDIIINLFFRCGGAACGLSRTHSSSSHHPHHAPRQFTVPCDPAWLCGRYTTTCLTMNPSNTPPPTPNLARLSRTSSKLVIPRSVHHPATSGSARTEPKDPTKPLADNAHDRRGGTHITAEQRRSRMGDNTEHATQPPVNHSR